MKSPAFQFYAQDFLTGVMYLTNEEIGLYIKMICKQWTDGKIPKKRLGLFLGYEWDNLSDELKEKFTDFGDYVINERLEQEREKKESFLRKQANNGSKGGRPKKNKPKQNPNETQSITQTITQKKPLEDEDEIEEEIEVDNKKEKEIEYPFKTQNFKNKWLDWVAYKKSEFNFKFKSQQSMQSSLTQLGNLSANENEAIAIIEQSMANGWKGFFKLKQQTNETNSTNQFPGNSKKAATYSRSEAISRTQAVSGSHSTPKEN